MLPGVNLLDNADWWLEQIRKKMQERANPSSSAIMRGEVPLAQPVFDAGYFNPCMEIQPESTIKGYQGTPLTMKKWNDIFGIDEKVADLPNPTYEKVESTLKLEELEHALPLLGLRVMIHPDKTTDYKSTFVHQTGTIVNLEGDKLDVKNVISRYKRGNRDISWKVEVKFDNGLSDLVRIMHMIPVGTEHVDLYEVNISGYGTMTWTKEEYEEKINDYVIVKGKSIRSKRIITNVERQLALDEA